MKTTLQLIVIVMVLLAACCIANAQDSTVVKRYVHQSSRLYTVEYKFLKKDNAAVITIYQETKRGSIRIARPFLGTLSDNADSLVSKLPYNKP
jgi:hypothetical protein